MSERFASSTEDESPVHENIKDDDEKSSKKKKKSSKALGKTLVRSEASADDQQKESEDKRGDKWESFLASIALKKDKEGAKAEVADSGADKENAEAEEIPQESPEGEGAEARLPEALPEVEPDSSINHIEQNSLEGNSEQFAEWRELSPQELSGGEVVINLREPIRHEAGADDVVQEGEYLEGEGAEGAEDAEVEIEPDSTGEVVDQKMTDEDIDYSATPSSSVVGGVGSSGGTTPPGGGSSGSGPSSTPSSSGGSSSGGTGSSSTSSSGGYGPGGPWPTSPGGYYGGAPTPAHAPVSPGVAPIPVGPPKPSYEDWRRGRKRGRREGLLAGVILGGGIEHLRHKSREKKMEKASKKVEQQHQKTMAETENKVNHLSAEQEALRRSLAQERLHSDQAPAEVKKPTVSEAPVLAPLSKFSAEIPMPVRTESVTQHVVARSETSVIASAAMAEKAKKDTEQAKADLIERLNAEAMRQEREREAGANRPDNRIETSAWHAIEVDDSGHAVQESTIEYGHEYHHEKAQEVGPSQQAGAKAIGGAIATAMASGGIDTNTNQSAHAQSVLPAVSSTQSVPTPTPQPASVVDDYVDEDHVPLKSLVPWLVVLGFVAALIAMFV